MIIPLQRNVHRQHGRKASDVVMPEGTLDLRQVGFIEKGAIARRFQVDAANFHVQRVFLRSDEQVGADRAQLAINFVADVGGDSNHGRSHSHAQSDGCASQ